MPATSKTAKDLIPKVQVALSKLERLQSMRRYRAPFPKRFKFDRDDANTR